MPRPLLTAGYGNRELDDVVALLRLHAVRYLIDVRSEPCSRFNPVFSKNNLAAAVEAAGTGYVFMGDSIGGRPADEACYDEAGHVDYLACREHPAFRHGFERLRTAWEQDAGVAILCGELRPEQCHRAKLIAEAMVAIGRADRARRRGRNRGGARDRHETAAGSADDPAGCAGRGRPLAGGVPSPPPERHGFAESSRSVSKLRNTRPADVCSAAHSSDAPRTG